MSKQLKDYSYTIPNELVAQEPLKERTDARLMVINRQTKKITHDYFKNLDQYLPRESLLVMNNSKVIPARLLGKKERSGGQVEIFLLRQLEDGCSYEVLLKPLKKIHENDKIVFEGSNVVAQLIDKEKRIVQFNQKNISSFLTRHGHMPLPPYIRREDEAIDREYYQTVYAKRKGSVAAPTAGLHFSQHQLEQLKKDGHSLHEVTLHVNYGTFKPVEESNITDHPMHTEEYAMAKNTLTAVKQAKKTTQKVIAVGTTSCRVLESIARNNTLKGATNLFIYPGHVFKYIDGLITNFHLPNSTLLMLVYAFGGMELMKSAYAQAIKKKYRFFSYGDAMMIL